MVDSIRVRRNLSAAAASVKLSGAQSEDGFASDLVMTTLRQKMLTLETKALKTKLAYAQAEVVKVASERKALEAKMVHAQTEVDTIQKCLEAYEQAEADLSSFLK